MNSDEWKPKVHILPDRCLYIEDSMDSLPLPSEIKDKEYVIVSCEQKVPQDEEEWRACGKWIWYNIEDPAHLDQMWKELQPYLSDETFIMIKASTAAVTGSSGVIFCYTTPKKDAIKRAAEAIRSVTKDNTLLYYKVNRQTEMNIYRRHGHKNISLYVYTAKGRFYRRDHLHRWILDEDRPFENKPACKSCTKDISLEQLPSNAGNNKQDLKHSTYFQKDGLTGWWSIKCDNSNRHRCGWTEADKIWAVAIKLYEEHIFSRIEYFRQAGVAYISCYVTSISNIEFLISCIRKVVKNADYLNPVYFYVYNESCDKITWKYKLTAEEELYEMFCDKGVSFEKFIM